MNLTDAQQVLAGTAWGEARGQGDMAMQAVINVVQNRVRLQTWTGKTVVEVCLKPWQFSSWNKTGPNRAKIMAVKDTDPQFAVALALADLAFNDELVDVTNGADSYFDTSIALPSWAKGKPLLKTIGALRFYKVL